MKIKLNDKVTMDLDKLVESRLLVQANSGGGKSWAIRRIVEQAFSHVQIIILDPEGEFSNLRSEFDFVYVGKGGDAPAEPRAAALLAKRLLELKASAIIDLYELAPQDRKHFVRLFCEAMVNAPKELWHDCLVIIDEAHVFAPEKGESEAMGAVIDLATRGRKRGYCVVLATQRLPKLNKDAAAECNNKLIGRASQDIDRKRAAEELGFTSKEQVLSLRDLNPGEFYAFGPAISREVLKLSIGEVAVKPAKRGVSRAKPPAPSASVKKILAQLKDLPQEAAEEAKTIQEFKAEIARLKREAKPLIRDRIIDALPPVPMGVSQWLNYGKKYGYDKFFESKFKDTLYQKLLKSHGNVFRALESLSKDIDALKQQSIGYPLPKDFKMLSEATKVMAPQKIYSESPASFVKIERFGENKPLSKGALTILTYLESVYPQERTKAQMSVATLYVPGGGFNNMLYELTGVGLIRKTPNGFEAMKEGDTPYFPSLENWIPKVSTGAGKILRLLLDSPEHLWSKERLANETGYSLGGGFNNMIYELTGKELVVRVGVEYKINPEILNL